MTEIVLAVGQVWVPAKRIARKDWTRQIIEIETRRDGTPYRLTWRKPEARSLFDVLAVEFELWIARTGATLREGGRMAVADPDKERVQPQAVEMHWIDVATGESLGTCIGSGANARPAWVAKYGDRWIEIFPRGVEYARPN